MGLDVYLYKTNGISGDELERQRVEYNGAYEAWWSDCPEYPNDGSAEDREAWSQQVDEWKAAKIAAGNPEPVDPEEGGGATQIEEPSANHPDHMFKIGYFRSSYNAGGINSVLGEAGLPTLYDIFDGADGYIVRPDWTAALDRAKDAIAQFDTEIDGGNLAYRVIDMEAAPAAPDEEGPGSEFEALQVFMAEKKQNEGREMPFGANYSNGRGLFLLDDPPKLYALIPGRAKYGFRCKQAVYAVVGASAEGLDHYRASLEIVQETIEYVLASGEPENFYFHWSS